MKLVVPCPVVMALLVRIKGEGPYSTTEADEVGYLLEVRGGGWR